MGFGKKYALQILGVWRDNLAEPVVGGLLCFLNSGNCYSNPVALRSVALRFPRFRGVSQENRATPPEKAQ